MDREKGFRLSSTNIILHKQRQSGKIMPDAMVLPWHYVVHAQ